MQIFFSPQFSIFCIKLEKICIRKMKYFPFYACGHMLSVALQISSWANHLRNKTCFPCLHSLVKTEANVWENSRADQCMLENSHNLCQGFQQAMEAWTTCFISFVKLLFSLLTTWRQSNHIAHAVFMLHSAMKTHL